MVVPEYKCGFSLTEESKWDWGLALTLWLRPCEALEKPWRCGVWVLRKHRVTRIAGSHSNASCFSLGGFSYFSGFDCSWGGPSELTSACKLITIKPRRLSFFQVPALASWKQYQDSKTQISVSSFSVSLTSFLLVAFYLLFFSFDQLVASLRTKP